MLYRALVITTVDGVERWLVGDQLREVFNFAGIEVPNCGRSAISRDLQAYVTTYGIVVTEVDSEYITVSSLIPPHQIKELHYIIAKAEPSVRRLDVILKRK